MGLGAGGLLQLSPITGRAGFRAKDQSSEQQKSATGSSSVRAIPAKDAAALLWQHDGGYRLLDIRPAWEREKAWVRGSLHVPLFVEDTTSDPLTFLKKWVHFGYVGLWTGQRFTTLNSSFLSDVGRLVSGKDEKLLVACGEGLRSIVAVKKLSKDGYENLAWLAGGFNRSAEGDFADLEGSTKLQYATVGGVSYFFLQLLLILRVIGPNK